MGLIGDIVVFLERLHLRSYLILLFLIKLPSACFLEELNHIWGSDAEVE